MRHNARQSDNNNCYKLLLLWLLSFCFVLFFLFLCRNIPRDHSTPNRWKNTTKGMKICTAHILSENLKCDISGESFRYTPRNKSQRNNTAKSCGAERPWLIKVRSKERMYPSCTSHVRQLKPQNLRLTIIDISIVPRSFLK